MHKTEVLPKTIVFGWTNKGTVLDNSELLLSTRWTKKLPNLFLS